MPQRKQLESEYKKRLDSGEKPFTERGSDSGAYNQDNVASMKQAYDNAATPEERAAIVQQYVNAGKSDNGLLRTGLTMGANFVGSLLSGDSEQSKIDEVNSRSDLVKAQTDAIKAKMAWQDGK